MNYNLRNNRINLKLLSLKHEGKYKEFPILAIESHFVKQEIIPCTTKASVLGQTLMQHMLRMVQIKKNSTLCSEDYNRIHHIFQ